MTTEGDENFCVLAVEGGRTRTVAVLADGQGNVLGIGVGGPADPLMEPGGPERMQVALEVAIHSAMLDAREPDFSRALGVRLAMAGGSAQAAQVVRNLTPYSQIVSELAPPAVLASITLGGPGVVVIAGTGSVAFARCPEGREVTVGGWGYAMGDEGGGHWIAHQALSAITKAADGRAEATALTALLLRHWGASNMMALQQKIYAGEIDQPGMASAAAVVGQAAQAGDGAAQRILRFAGHELGHLAVTALTRLSMRDGPVTVGVTGGVFRAGTALLEPFQQIVQQTIPQAQIARPRVAPVLGALALALHDLGISITPEIAARLEAATSQVESAQSS